MLKVRNLTVQYASGQELFDLSFQVQKGQILAIVGPNDGGKSLLGRVVADPEVERRGEVIINHLNSAHDAEKTKFSIGYSPDRPIIEPYLTGYEQLDFIGSVFSMSPTERAKRITELSSAFDLGDDLYRLIETYDLGQIKKLSLAGSLIHRPSVVVWEEPTASLDPAGQRAVRHQLKELTDDKTAILLISNDLPLVEETAEEIMVLQNGTEAMIGTLAQLKNRTGSKAKDLTEVLELVSNSNA